MKRRGGAGKRSAGLVFEEPEADEDSAGEERRMQESSDSDDGMMMDEGSDDEEIESEWEFFPFGDMDWHAVKQHCVRMLDQREWNVGSLASLITETQKHVGSAIKLGERTSEALGIGAVVNMRQFAETPCVQAAQAFVLSRFQGAELQRLQEILSRRAVGWFVNERLLNLPPLVALHLHLSMFEEMEAQSADAGSPYRLDYFLFITVAYRDSTGDKAQAGDRKKARDKEVQLEWFRPEEEIYAEHAELSAMWPVSVQDQASRWTFDGRIAQFKVVMLVPTAAVPKIAARFREINGE